MPHSIPKWLRNGEDKYINYTYSQIDCSNLVYQILKDSGSAMPYLTTAQLNNKNIRMNYYDEVSGNAVKPGDIVLFNGHMGIIKSYDPKTGRGTFFGSQTSTGPDIVDFGPGTGYWDKPHKILEIKPQYYPTNGFDITRLDLLDPAALQNYLKKYPQMIRPRSSKNNIGSVLSGETLRRDGNHVLRIKPDGSQRGYFISE